ncbi:DUF559 domain-containing protein [Candidatus Giovannonibacteria bacterium]|nr:DUF559 domain-containing protein [Candidatus Giovannonibacteria bacterium]
MTEIFNRRTYTFKRKLLRKNLPEAEIILWSQLKNKNIKGYKFRRQYGIGRYVTDFYCPELKLSIEIDGDYHSVADVKDYDIVRQDYFKSLDIDTLRFTNNNIKHNLSTILKEISRHCP